MLVQIQILTLKYTEQDKRSRFDRVGIRVEKEKKIALKRE